MWAGRSTKLYPRPLHAPPAAGDFVRDKQEGLGALFLLQRQRKYVAEYVNGAPTCGCMLDIDNADLELLEGQLAALALHRRLEGMNSGELCAGKCRGEGAAVLCKPFVCNAAQSHN